VTVTDEQVAMLRAHLNGDKAEHDRLAAEPDPPDFQPGFNALVATAFVEAVNRRFGRDRLLADIVRFVAHMRAEFLRDPDLLDPIAAEKLIQAALGDQQAAAELDDDAKARGQVFLLPALVDEAKLDRDGVDGLLTTARNQTDNLAV
jgi:hypothetical protein